MEIYKKLPTDLQKIVDRMLHELRMLDVFKYLDYKNLCCYGCKQLKSDCEIYCINYTYHLIQNFCLSCGQYILTPQAFLIHVTFYQLYFANQLVIFYIFPCIF